ncbi:retinitis pigmentosa 9 protein [Meleagris gallopavo]|uniref:retinitis pigmentosa 9 protein n=1 Tax=Meleagris gallopavo TaxID=9103 RepID=UPI00093DEB2D|nr:retinitis pigmentosa 9 protein [Meleagris gallopavo]
MELIRSGGQTRRSGSCSGSTAEREPFRRACCAGPRTPRHQRRTEAAPHRGRPCCRRKADGAARGSQARHGSFHDSAGGGRSQGRHERKRKKQEAQQLQKLQHLESFYEKPPPGLIKEEETKPEDCIPDVPGNESAREFLAHAPTKGLWMPLGKEVKVMQCWRCKRYGHRTGDKECPFFIKGNQKLEQFRVAHEDPMYDIIRETKRHEKEMRIQQLKQLLEDSTSDDDSSDEDDEDSSSSTSSDKHKKKKRKKEKKKKEKKKKKKRKHK